MTIFSFTISCFEHDTDACKHMIDLKYQYCFYRYLVEGTFISKLIKLYDIEEQIWMS